LRRDDGPAPQAVLVVVGVVSAVVAYLDLFGADADVWGAASLFAIGSVVAFLVPVAIVGRLRYDRWVRQPAWHGWPDVLLAVAGGALACSVLARVIGEGGIPGLLAAAVGAAAMGYAAKRLTP
jgi:hypothetical protein